MLLRNRGSKLRKEEEQQGLLLWEYRHTISGGVK